MASEWFMRKNGEEDGPFSSQQLKQMAGNGLLAAEDLVWKEGMDEWRPAGESRRLFPKSGRGQKKRSSRSSQIRSPEAEIRAVVPAGDSMLPKLPLPTDRRVRMALVGGGAVALLMLVVTGVVLMGFLGDSAEDDGQQRIAAVGGNDDASGVSKSEPRNEQPADGVLPDSPAVRAQGVSGEAGSDLDGEPPRVADIPLPAGLLKIREYELPSDVGSGRAAEATAVALSPDDKHLAVGLADGRLLVFNTVEGESPRRTERAHPGGDRASPLTDHTASISFSPSGLRVGWGTTFRHFAIVDPVDGSIVWRSPVMAKGLRGDFGPPQVVLKDDDTLLVATGSGISELSTIDICRPLNGGTPWQGMGLDSVVREGELTFVTKSGEGIAARGPGRWPVQRSAGSRVVAISSDGTAGGLLMTNPSGASLTVFELGGDAFTTQTKGLPTDVGSIPRLVVRDKSSAVLAAGARVHVVAGTDQSVEVDLPPSSSMTELAVDAEHRHLVVGKATGQVSLIAMEGTDKESAAKIMHQWAGIGTKSPKAAINSAGTRLAVLGKGSVILFQIGDSPPDP
jgi:hypothetical protein